MSLNKEPTRQDRILDLYITNSISDHEGSIVADIVKMTRFQSRRNQGNTLCMPRRSEAKWRKILRSLRTSIYDPGRTRGTKTENWKEIQRALNEISIVQAHQRCHQAGWNQPFITGNLKRKARKKHQMYEKAKRTCNPDRWQNSKPWRRSPRRVSNMPVLTT